MDVPRHHQQCDPGVFAAALIPGDEEDPALLPGLRPHNLRHGLRKPTIGPRDAAIVTVVAHARCDPGKLRSFDLEIRSEIAHWHDVRWALASVVRKGIV